MNGVIVVYGRLQPIIVTLATGAVAIGLALFIRPKPGGEIDPDLNWAVTNSLWDLVDTYQLFDPDAAWFVPFGWIPTPFVVLIAMACLVWIPFRKSVTGRTVYAIGSAEGAAYMSGCRSTEPRLLPLLSQASLPLAVGSISQSKPHRAMLM